MPADMRVVVHMSGILASIGALLYAIGDALLLVSKVGPTRNDAGMAVDVSAYPTMRRRAELFASI